MRLPKPLVRGKIIKRYKRFLADIELEDGKMVTAHIANTGSMKTCWEPGWTTLLSLHDDAKRKLPYSVQAIYNGSTWIGVNTALANKLAREAIEKHLIPELDGYKIIEAEYKIGNSRLDFYLQKHMSQENCYLEIKNVTLLGSQQTATFPDAVSTRGQKHLQELIALKEQNRGRAVMLYIVQREDVVKFMPAQDIDLRYAELLKEAVTQGVEILVYQCRLTPEEIIVHRSLPYEI